MASDVSTDDVQNEVQRGRRAVLFGAGAVAAAAGAAVLAPETANANAGDSLILGAANNAQATGTSLTNSDGVSLQITNSNPGGLAALYGISGNPTGGLGKAAGAIVGETDITLTAGVAAGSTNYHGLVAISKAAGYCGIYAFNGSSGGDAILGQSVNAVGVHGVTAGSGTAAVLGADNSGGGSSSGVTGSSGGGKGVAGYSSTGVGVYGSSNSGNGVYGASAASGGVGVNAVGSGGAQALKVSGTSTFSGSTTFSRSGLLTVASGSSSITKTGIGLTTHSLVLATIQGAGGAGNAVSYVTTTSSSFTIHLLKAATASTTVAWFIVN